MASIIVVSGPSEGDYYPLATETVVVGRDAKCPIQIVDEKMSRVHLEIRYDESVHTYVVKDLKSVNGVIVNNRAISDETPLSDGDVIEAGETKLMFFTKQFADRKSAWDFYKMADERSRPTMVHAPDPPKKRGLFGKRQ